MSKITHTVKSHWRQLNIVMRNEYAHIFRDAGVILIMVFAPIIYATIYSTTYGSQVLRNVPIGVVDMSKTDASRKLVEAIGMGPNTVIAYELDDMTKAERKFYERDIYGIIYIPDNYEKMLLGGQMATVSICLDASYMLMYRQAFQEMVAGINTTGAMVEFQRLIARGAEIPQAKAITQPVIYQGHSLFNPYLGYGTFVMPPIIMLIIQQTLLIGIGMIGGTWREQGLYGKLKPKGSKRLSTLPIVTGKALVYASIYAVSSFYLLNVHYRLFHYPMNGNAATIAVFLAMYLFACIFMGIAVSTLFRRRETSLMLMLWTSIPLFLLSGASYPAEAMDGSTGEHIPQHARRPGIRTDTDDGRVARRGAARNKSFGTAHRDISGIVVHRHTFPRGDRSRRHDTRQLEKTNRLPQDGRTVGGKCGIGIPTAQKTRSGKLLRVFCATRPIPHAMA